MILFKVYNWGEYMKKDNNFIKGALILSFAGVIVKILGALYRIPIANIISSEGMGYYSTAHPFYVLLLTISTAGFPVAIAKLVSEKRANNDFRGAFEVFKLAVFILTIGGMFSFLFLIFKAKDIVASLGNENAYYSLIALAPALFFVPIMSAFRGFFQGSSNMLPTAISQIGEQFSRLVMGLFLTLYLLERGIPIAAGAASFGASIGAFIGTVIIVFIFFKNKTAIDREINSSLRKGDYNLLNISYDLLIIALPITLGAAILPIIDTIDAGLVLRRLQHIGYTRELSNSLYGQLKGYAQILVNLPQVFSMAIGMSLVPAISSSYAKKDKKNTQTIISSGIRITLLIAFPCSLGLFILAKPIIALLFFNNTRDVIMSTAEMLKLLSFGVVFLTLTQTLTSILQGLGKPLIPVINLLIGAIVKIILTFTLTSIKTINIKGPAISTVVAFSVAAVLNFLVISKKYKIKINYRDVIIKPFICAFIMAFGVKLSFYFIAKLLSDNLATIISIAIGGLTYIILLIITNTITSEDFKLIPKSEKIINRVKSFNK